MPPSPPTTSRPIWAHLLSSSPDWAWHSGKLVHRNADLASAAPAPRSFLRRALVRYVYATQNSSPAVQKAISALLNALRENEWGLNLGAGSTRLHPRLLNLDICDGPEMDIVAHGQDLPFADNSLSLVISQEVLEHLPSPQRAVEEVHRILKPGGKFYCQVPFIIGYHPGPTDFWRFSREGLEQLFAGPRWQVRELALALGHGSGFYRIAVEYCAVNASLLSKRLYLPVKAFSALALLPLKWPDLFTHHSPQKDRIPGGYFCVVEKV